MRILFVTLILILSSNQRAWSLDLFNYLETSKFPEERINAIELDNIESELDPEQTTVFSGIDLIGSANSIVSNKFELGTGVVDVTQQVRKGVKTALKETFTGFAEHQRRKMTEEFLNSNFYSHKLGNEFLLGVIKAPNSLIDNIFNWFQKDFSNPNLVELIRKIISQDQIQSLHETFKTISWKLLIVLSLLFTFKQIINNSLTKNFLLRIIGAYCLIANIGMLIDVSLSLFSLISNFCSEQINLDLDSINLAQSWEKLANQIGYMPTMILSVIDILSQFLAYFFLIAIVIYIIICKILSPFAAVCLIDRDLSKLLISSSKFFLKLLIILVLIPLVYLIINYIGIEFSDLGLYFLEIVISISSFLVLPLIIIKLIC